MAPCFAKYTQVILGLMGRKIFVAEGTLIWHIWTPLGDFLFGMCLNLSVIGTLGVEVLSWYQGTLGQCRTACIGIIPEIKQ